MKRSYPKWRGNFQSPSTIHLLICLFAHLLIFMLIGLLACTSIAANEETKKDPLKIGDDAPDFTLLDANDQPHSLNQLRGKLILLILGNRKIRQEDDKWARAFQKDYKDNDRVIAYIIADMRSVPGFIPEGFIKNQLKKNKPPVTLLLDWIGKVHEAYHTQKEKPNLYLIDSEGQIAFYLKSNFNEETYQQLKTVIESKRALVRENTKGSN
ncbi:redoxin domain-containing protein [Candidatus Poribacteria bacterium]|nr:redoxin domain-containing protein [Candidatus Poribacteria bacterium]